MKIFFRILKFIAKVLFEILLIVLVALRGGKRAYKRKASRSTKPRTSTKGRKAPSQDIHEI
jgi:bacteriorhodopsin